MREQGLAGMEAPGFQGLVGPAGMPREIIERLSTDLRKVLAQRRLKAKFAAAGAEVNPRGPGEFADYVKAESERWSALIKQRKIQLQ